MDHYLLDSLARRLATTTPRRTGAVAIAVTSLAVLTGRAAATLPITTCRKTRQQCATNEECCSGLCRVHPDPQRSRCARPNRKRRDTNDSNEPNDRPEVTCLAMREVCELENGTPVGTCCQHHNCEYANPCSASDGLACDSSVHPTGVFKYCCAVLDRPCEGVGDCCNGLQCNSGTCGY